ncbi:MAG: DUF3817 domain-containing protein [Pirellulaceae bacterium]|nr:DUF3817 domain-containing protein [Pirellulaceae bacterium]
MSINLDFLHKLRRLSLCEGVSTLLLFGVAMPLKYFANLPQAVSIVGMLHGILFICLVVTFLLAIQKVPLKSKLAFAGILAAIVPFGPFVVDRWLKRIETEHDQKST